MSKDLVTGLKGLLQAAREECGQHMSVSLLARIDAVLADPATNCAFGDGCIGAPPEAMCRPCQIRVLRSMLATGEAN